MGMTRPIPIHFARPKNNSSLAIPPRPQKKAYGSGPRVMVGSVTEPKGRRHVGFEDDDCKRCVHYPASVPGHVRRALSFVV
ncbi:hypothetical protein Sinac_7287 [Singulisphaera acidiphila DSM 18658]|uniref:Uncharacterized protein n=1 Tax=Singulisphaera acidiphila (strain ATCC BAA-1392 / DSM 18658 / VKM B-2454 / MOB10) TaxID=886293 RepID=L0DPN0_SINAD|nr:hypothetical protein Sinac_7287 [Singulisphaera acidiphila DSM 18658]